MERFFEEVGFVEGVVVDYEGDYVVVVWFVSKCGIVGIDEVLDDGLVGSIVGCCVEVEDGEIDVWLGGDGGWVEGVSCFVEFDCIVFFLGVFCVVVGEVVVELIVIIFFVVEKFSNFMFGGCM